MFTELSRHMEKIRYEEPNDLDKRKKLDMRNQMIWIKGKNTENHTSCQKNQYSGKKK